MVQRIDHVVIAVNDLNEGTALYEKTFGLKPSRTGERPGDGFKSAFYDLPGGGFVELIQPTDATGPVAKGLAARAIAPFPPPVSFPVRGKHIDIELSPLRKR
jgi:catechol 2,3-dioxygenase-like lactoylglutathione lyase family enzyme